MQVSNITKKNFYFDQANDIIKSELNTNDHFNFMLQYM